MAIKTVHTRVLFDAKQLSDIVRARMEEDGGFEKVADAIAEQAEQNHTFINRTGKLEHTIRVEKAYTWLGARGKGKMSKKPSASVELSSQDIVWLVRAWSKRAKQGHLIELGHALIKNGKHIGHVSAKPFMGPAAEAVYANIESYLGMTL